MSSMTTAVLGERGDADLAAADLEHQLGARAAWPAQEPEHDPDVVVFEAAERFAASLALSVAALELAAGPGLPAALDDGGSCAARSQPAVAARAAPRCRANRRLLGAAAPPPPQPHAEALRRADRRQTLPSARYRNARRASVSVKSPHTPGRDEARASDAARWTPTSLLHRWRSSHVVASAVRTGIG
jgi:hypothetical protein